MLAARVGVLVVVSALTASCVNLSYPPDAGALVAQKAAGKECKENRECQSAFCSHGICCKTACDGPCETCGEIGSGSEGVCTLAKENTNPRGMCTPDPVSTCGFSGVCDGAGNCAKYAPGTLCGDQKCFSNRAYLASRCSAAGTCDAGGEKACKPYGCGPDGNCGTTCATDDDCANGSHCMGGSCGKKALGTPCSGDDDECDSMFCSPQKVCCDKRCDGACVSCTLKGSEGVCTNVPAGMPPTPGMMTTCATDPVATCGTDGKCDGAGLCRLYQSGTVCTQATCSTATLRNAATCDGKMHCQVPAAVTCGGYTCASATACRTSCTADADCASPSVCCTNSTICGGNACGGLSAQYFRQTNLTDLAFTRTDPNINFDWHGGTPSDKLNVDNFSVRWRGKLTPRYSETYTFYAGSDDGERLFVNGMMIIDHYMRHASVPEDISATMPLQAGKPVDIVFEYFENGGDANVRLLWSSKSETKAVIPTSAFAPQ